MSEEKNLDTKHNSTSTSLDDEQRVKVLSPGMMVAKRFFRNRLAMVGLIIIVCMFLFSFVGGMFAPYSEKQVFRTTETAIKDYAGVAENKDWQYSIADGKDFPAAAQAQMILAINKEQTSFTAKDVTYGLLKKSDNLYYIVQGEEIATTTNVRGAFNYNEVVAGKLTDSVKAAYEAAVATNATEFDADGVHYSITQKGRMTSINVAENIAIASKFVFSGATADIQPSFTFKCAALDAVEAETTSVEIEGTTYTIKENDEGALFYKDGKEYVLVSTYNISPANDGVFLTLDFRRAALEAIDKGKEKFSYTDEEGKETEYVLKRKNEQYTVRNYVETQVNDTYAKPSKTHILGTDGHGMDMLTRLMFGGRISLMVGFVTVILEVFIGVIMGGVAGYFGGWVDTLIMRLVDIFYCIPSLPLYIILGAIMDFWKIDPQLRIFVLCAMLGLLGWAGVARMVRGQILSLREQEFMTAAEALGISTHRRIFVHLIPNVVPQLIVIATMGLGDTILTEATLSFLGLGVKFPYASWGNIINAVNDSYVMTNFWFVWIPAGILILLTVLGFNFIGDGLRDAFDPKMKR
ncbi:ABC transporter permease [Roseburia sp. MSJ-14]|uniref:ABC transporter permease n=1 Tax=Roseburia sp. MSJ-14 TaxID=2841514 RepID=UPI001C0FE877|nr:ABC transporter permease [Roseburia sp. MSJ-14]MBU5474038.1 ABC transporter permease [Roseburia sp. MSJ-14]